MYDTFEFEICPGLHYLLEIVNWKLEIGNSSALKKVKLIKLKADSLEIYFSRVIPSLNHMSSWNKN